MTLTVTAEVAEGWPPRVLVEVDSSPSVVDRLRLYRVHEDGSRHRVLLSGRLIGGWSGFDYHPPFNQQVTYVAASGGQESAPSPVTMVTADYPLLHHASDPDLTLRIDKILAPIAPKTWASRANEYLPVRATGGGINASSYAGWGPMDSKITIQIRREDEQAVIRLLRPDLPVLINGPWGPDDHGWMWIQPKSVSIVNVPGLVQFPTRQVEIDYRESRPPDVPPKPVWTIAEATAAFPGATLADMVGVWASLGDARIDRRA